MGISCSRTSRCQVVDAIGFAMEKLSDLCHGQKIRESLRECIRGVAGAVLAGLLG
jgi:hypothetical protein